MKFNLAVAPYIYYYLISQYGPGPYDITDNKDLRMSFAYWDIKAEANIPPLLTTESTIKIAMSMPDTDLLTPLVYKINRAPKRNTFFLTEFWQAAAMYIAGQIEATIPEDEEDEVKRISRRAALSNFLIRSGIPEDIYPLTTAYRALTRYLTDRPYLLQA